MSDSRRKPTDLTEADQILATAFAASGRKPSTKSPDKLLRRRDAIVSRWILWERVSLVLLLVWLIAVPVAGGVILSRTTPAAKTTAPADYGTLHLVEHYETNGTLCLVMSEMDIDEANSYMVTADGVKTPPVSADDKTGTLVFPFPESEANIFVYAENGAFVQLLFDPGEQ